MYREHPRRKLTASKELPAHAAGRAFQGHNDPHGISRLRPRNLNPKFAQNYAVTSQNDTAKIETFNHKVSPSTHHLPMERRAFLASWSLGCLAMPIQMAPDSSGRALSLLRDFIPTSVSWEQLTPRSTLSTSKNGLKLPPNLLHSWWPNADNMQRQLLFSRSLSPQGPEP